MAAPTPRMHGVTHVPGGPDPIPGLMVDRTSGSLDDAVLAAADAFWKLNETSGTVANDSSGNGHSLSGTAPVWGQPAGPPGTPTAGWAATEARLTGTLAAFTDNFTAGVWVRVTAGGGGEMMGQGTSYHVGTGWSLMAVSSKIAVLVAGNPLYANTNYTADTWYFAAVVRDAGTWKLYINGVQQTATTTDSPGTGYGGNTWIGSDAYGSHTTYLVNTRLSYGFIAGHVLTAAELLAMYEAGTGTGGPSDGDVWTSDGAGGAAWETPTAASDPAKVDRDAVEAAVNRLVAVKLAAGDTQPAFRILGDGTHQWGAGGTTAPDQTLGRPFGGYLQTNGGFLTKDMYAWYGLPQQLYLGSVGGNAGAYFGSANDTNLYRSAAGTLKTDGTLQVGAALGVVGQTVLNGQIYVAGSITGGASGPVSVGPNDSAGAGYRYLRIPN